MNWKNKEDGVKKKRKQYINCTYLLLLLLLMRCDIVDNSVYNCYLLIYIRDKEHRNKHLWDNKLNKSTEVKLNVRNVINRSIVSDLFCCYLWCVVVFLIFSVYNCNGRMVIIYKQQWHKRLSKMKRNKGMDTKLNMNTQLIDRSWPPSSAISVVVLWYCCLFCRLS